MNNQTFVDILFAEFFRESNSESRGLPITDMLLQKLTDKAKQYVFKKRCSGDIPDGFPCYFLKAVNKDNYIGFNLTDDAKSFLAAN